LILQQQAQELALAGVWPRVMSIVYEALIVAAILFLATALVLIFTRHAIAPGTLWFELYLLSVVGAYFCYCWRRSGQTVGMFAWRLMLTDLSGKRLGYAHGALRFLIATVLGFGLLGLLWALVDIDGVALQDRLSKSRVLRLPVRHKT
jgi:uncharacterized RDD family membrane protein YckC